MCGAAGGVEGTHLSTSGCDRKLREGGWTRAAIESGVVILLRAGNSIVELMLRHREWTEAVMTTFTSSVLAAKEVLKKICFVTGLSQLLGVVLL